MKRHGGELRGNARNRRARKLWFLSRDSGFGGDAARVPCFWCGDPLTYKTVESDRWPITGREGGRYIRGNTVPACRRCNCRARGTPAEAVAFARALAEVAA